MKSVKIAIVHPRIVAGGGSESVALWILQSLQDEYDLSLITIGDVDFKKLNEWYGTDLHKDKIKVISLPNLIFFKKFDALANCHLARFAKKIATRFDGMISTYNPMDFGRPGIQFVADLSFDDQLRRIFDVEPAKSKQWLYRDSLVRRAYLIFARMISGNEKKGWNKNTTVANSEWTKKILETYYGFSSAVVYPPAVVISAKIPWEKKENRFIFLGRISPEKQIEKIIRILSEVRKRGCDIQLYIVGRIDDDGYADMIQKMCSENNSWCFLKGQMFGRNKLDFISHSKYGISARTYEPFGISVAEMVALGCVVFVPDGGGQAEIVGNDDIKYSNEEDAVIKIEHILKNMGAQLKVRDFLLARNNAFSLETFKKEIKSVVHAFLKEKEAHIHK